jgi:ABC-type transporter Mla subunit MlaD
MSFLQGWIAFTWVQRRMDRFEARLRRLEARMATFEQVVSDLNDVTNNLADRIEESERINAQLREAVAANDTARAQALADQAQAHADVLSQAVDKLRGLGQSTENPVPDPEPVTPAPDVPADPGTGTTTDPSAPDAPVVTDPGLPTDAGDQSV